MGTSLSWLPGQTGSFSEAAGGNKRRAAACSAGEVHESLLFYTVDLILHAVHIFVCLSLRPALKLLSLTALAEWKRPRKTRLTVLLEDKSKV